jgi:hypothetical protein
LLGWPSDQAPKMARSAFSATDTSGYCGCRPSWVRSGVSLGAGRRSSHRSQRGSLTSPPQGCSSAIWPPRFAGRGHWRPYSSHASSTNGIASLDGSHGGSAPRAVLRPRREGGDTKTRSITDVVIGLRSSSAAVARPHIRCGARLCHVGRAMVAAVYVEPVATALVMSPQHLSAPGEN